MEARYYLIPSVIAVALLIGVLTAARRFGVSLPSGVPSSPTTVTATSEGHKTAREVTVTKGVKHSVPLEEIIGGGPPRDGIPSIDDPKFTTPVAASAWLRENEPGLAISLEDAHRFYPFQILVWHEIVNDTLPSGRRILVTYCPLCFSGIVFDPLVQGKRVAFGTSGKLWNSNLVMYDRKTESLWSQVLGEAIQGERTGEKLTVLPSDIVRFGVWRVQHPNGVVLSRETGATRFYGRDPYGDYYTTPGVLFPIGHRDARLGEKELVLGLVVDGRAKAYHPLAVKAKGEIVDTVAGKTIVARHDVAIDAVRIFERKPDGSEERLNPFAAYWFSWVAAHPETELYQ